MSNPLRPVRLLLPLLFAAALPGLLRADAPAESLRFAWPAPARVKVTEKIEKKGQKMTTRYTLTLAPSADGKVLHLNYSEYEILEFNGMKADTPEAQQALAPAIAMAGAIPTLVIGKDGTFQDVIGMEETIKKTLDFMKSQGKEGLTPEMEKTIRERLLAPEMVAQMKAKCGDTWNVWVGTWLLVDFSEQKEVVAVAQVPVPGGEPVDLPTTYRHQGPAAGSDRHVRLEVESVLEGDEARAVLLKSMAGLVPPGALKPGQSLEDMFESFRREFHGWVETDPRTLMPRRASSEMVNEVTMTSGESRTQREVHEYAFDWSAPTPAGK